MKSVFPLAWAVIALAGFAMDAPAEALEIFGKEDFEVVPTDSVMSAMRGEEMAPKMKALRPAVPIILMTGLFRDPTIIVQFDAFLQKPFTHADLRAALQKALSPASSG